MGAGCCKITVCYAPVVDNAFCFCSYVTKIVTDKVFVLEMTILHVAFFCVIKHFEYQDIRFCSKRRFKLSWEVNC